MKDTKILYDSSILYTLNYRLGVDYIEDSRVKINRTLLDIIKRKGLGKDCKLFITCHNSDSKERTGYMVLNPGIDLMSVITKENFFRVTVYKRADKILVMYVRDMVPIHSTWIIEVKRGIEGLCDGELISRWLRQNRTKRVEGIRLVN